MSTTQTPQTADIGRIEEIEARLQELEEENERLRDDLAETRRENAELRQQVHEHEERIEDLEDGHQEDDEKPAHWHDYTLVERVSQWDYDTIEDEQGASERRAAALHQNWSRWSKKTPKGEMISIANGDVKVHLEDVFDESVEWNQAKRAADKLESMSDGAYRHVETTSGHAVVRDKGTVLASEKDTSTGGTTPSSVAAD